MADPTQSVVNETYENVSIQCAKIVVTDASASLKLPRVCGSNGNYIFQLVCKADSTKTLTVLVGNVTETIQVTASFSRYVAAFSNVNVANSNDCYITFPTGTYYVYNVQLEKANTPSGWRPAPEDAEDYTNEQVTTLDNTLDQQDVFNRLTNNGQTQGIYLQNGKVYINASFIQSGTISANYISGGTIDADDVSIINLTADHLQSYGNNGTWQLDSQASYLDLRQLDNSVWKQRGALFINNADGGTLRVSKGDVDSSGNPLSGTSYRTFVMPGGIRVGTDKDGNHTGYVNAGTVSAAGAVSAGSVTSSGDISATGNISSSGNISATSGNGNFKYINADTIGSEKESTSLSTVGDEWSFSISGCRFICIEGQAGSLEIQTTVIPCAAISNYTYGWRLATGTTAYTVSRSGSTCTVALTAASNSTCRLLRCYSIV